MSYSDPYDFLESFRFEPGLAREQLRVERLEAMRQAILKSRNLGVRGIEFNRTELGWSGRLKPRGRGAAGVLAKNLTFDEDPDFDPENPTVKFNGGNFAGKNIDMQIIPITDDDVQYMFGRVNFNYAGKIENATIDVFFDNKDPDDPDRQNGFPDYEDGQDFEGEAWYYIGKFVRVPIPETSPEQFEVEFRNVHSGGNVLFEFGCDGNIRWGRR